MKEGHPAESVRYVHSTATNAGLAIVTGASSGIGKATALAFARRGFFTLLIARRAAELAEVASVCAQTAPSTTLLLDLSETRCIESAFRKALDGMPIDLHAGGMTVLVNNAGAGVFAPFLDHDPESFERVVRLNYLAPVRMMRAVLPRMLAAGRGHIFNIGSMSSIVGSFWHPAYGPSKAALRNLTEAVAAEHQEAGVYVTTVFPGIIRTPYFDAPDMRQLWQVVHKRAIEPEVVAEAMVRTLGRRRLRLHVPGFYGLLEIVASVSPALAVRLVRANASPAGIKHQPARPR